jgi:hypothetical protein
MQRHHRSTFFFLVLARISQLMITLFPLIIIQRSGIMHLMKNFVSESLRKNNEKEQWKQDQFHQIALESHHIAVRRIYHHKKFSCKLLHDMLPTGKSVHSYSSHYDHPCPSCRTPYEDQSHFFCSPQRQQWRHDAWFSIKKFVEKIETRRGFSELLLFIVKDWKFDSDNDANEYHHDTKTLITWQFKIGWA